MVGFAAGVHASVDVMDPLLGGVGDLQHMLGLPRLSVLQGRAGPWFTGVMPR